MDSKVRFEGMGPFHLPVAQEASVTPLLSWPVADHLSGRHGRRRQGDECGNRPDQCGRCIEAL